MSEHTKEPWRVSDDPELPGAVVIDARGYMVCDANVFGTSPDAPSSETCDANGNRIVECVNACLGIKDPATTVPELVATLHAVTSFFEPKSSLPPDIQENFRRMVANEPILQRVHAVLAKVKETR